MAAFKKESTQYGVLYYPIINKAEKTGTVEIMAKAKDARQINRILERMGVAVPHSSGGRGRKKRAVPCSIRRKIQGIRDRYESSYRDYDQ